MGKTLGMNEDMKTKKRQPMYNAEIWTSDKLKFSFWYPQHFFDDLDDDVKKCLSGARNELWLGNYNDIELHLEDWEGNHYSAFDKAEFSIPWAKVIMWDLSINELD